MVMIDRLVHQQERWRVPLRCHGLVPGQHQGQVRRGAGTITPPSSDTQERTAARWQEKPTQTMRLDSTINPHITDLPGTVSEPEAV